MYYSDFKENLWKNHQNSKLEEYVSQYINPFKLDDCGDFNTQSPDSVALLGFVSDEGIRRNSGRTGAVKGPDAFRKVFANLPVHRPLKLFDAGDVVCQNRNLEQAQGILGEKVSQILQFAMKPVVIGGGSETSWGHFQGIWDFFQQNQLDYEQLAILSFDAHFNCFPSEISTAENPFYQIYQFLQDRKKKFNYFCAGIQPRANVASFFDFAKHNQLHYQLAEEISYEPFNTNFVEYVIDRFKFIYVSVCLNVFHASIAPGVNLPQTLGIYPEYVMYSLRKLRNSGKLLSCDIVALSPDFDPDQRTTGLATELVAELIL